MSMDLLSHPLVADWLPGLLLHAVWIGAATAMVAWIGLKAVRGPGQRHTLLLTMFVALIGGLAVVACWTWPSIGQSGISESIASSHHQTSPIAAGGMLSSAQAIPTTTTSASSLTWLTRISWSAWLVMAWTMGVAALALRCAVAWWQVGRLCRAGFPASAELESLFDGWRRRMRVESAHLRLTSHLAVPAAVGWWRQVVLLPAGLATGLPIDQVEALVLHELAHLRRHDWLVEVVISMLELLLFFHPAVHWMGRQLREAREQCCDLAAVGAGAEPEGFARALLALAERIAPDSPMLAATGGRLEARVRRLLGAPQRRSHGVRALLAILLLPTVAVILAACTRAGDASRNQSDGTAVDRATLVFPSFADQSLAKNHGAAQPTQENNAPNQDPAHPTELSLKIYDVRDLVDQAAPLPQVGPNVRAVWQAEPAAGVQTTIESLVKVIAEAIPAKSRMAGGSTEVLAGNLVVTADQAFHKHLDRMFQDLRQRRRMQIHIRTRVAQPDAATWELLGFSDDAQRLVIPDSGLLLEVVRANGRNGKFAAKPGADHQGDGPGDPWKGMAVRDLPELTLLNGQRAALHADKDAIVPGLELIMRSIASADGRYLALELGIVQPSPGGEPVRSVRTTIVTPDGDTLYVRCPDQKTLLIIRQDSVLFDEIETRL